MCWSPKPLHAHQFLGYTAKAEPKSVMRNCVQSKTPRGLASQIFPLTVSVAFDESIRVVASRDFKTIERTANIFVHTHYSSKNKPLFSILCQKKIFSIIQKFSFKVDSNKASLGHFHLFLCYQTVNSLGMNWIRSILRVSVLRSTF